MSYRYGGKARPGSQVQRWLNNAEVVNPWPKPVNVASAVTVTADVSTHTKGAWTEVIASSSGPADLVYLYVINAQSATATEGLLDVGVGSAGSEVVVVSNAVGGSTSITSPTVGVTPGVNPLQIFPVNIPAGSRVAVRIQNVVSSRTANVSVSLLYSGQPAPSTLDTIGATTATSRGTNLPTSNTYVQLVASTSQTYRGVVMVCCAAGSAQNSESSVYTLAVGGSGSEVELGTATFASNASEFSGCQQNQPPFIYYGYIPAGSRLAVKQSVGRTYRDVILYGIPF